MIEHCEVVYVYTHIWLAYHLFQCFDISHCHQVALVSFGAEVALVVIEVDPVPCVSSMTADSMLCHFGKKRIHLFHFHKSLPDVFLSLPSTFHAQETQLVASSLLGLRCEVGSVVGAFL
jgi:hypothetical protein